MNLNSNFEEMVHAHMEATRIAFDAGYEAGYRAALDSLEARLKHLGENTQAIIEASREPALTRKQA